jgi:hypothetical protein
MNFIKGFIQFVKNFARSFYDNTLGPVVVLAKNTVRGQVCETDKPAMQTVALVVLLTLAVAILPAGAFITSLLGTYAIFSAVGALANTFFQLADIYKVEPAVA